VRGGKVLEVIFLYFTPAPNTDKKLPANFLKRDKFVII